MNDSNPSTASREEDWHDELVAYLDGEVSTEERERIEKRLSDDEAYRSQLVELERSWRLLDRLPTAEEDRDFTKSTIAMVAADLSNTTANGKPKGGFRIPWLKLLATVAACTIGFLAVTLPNRGQRNTAVEDLAVAQNIDLYVNAGRMDFLKVMHEAGLFQDEDPASEAEWSQTSDTQKIRSGIENLDENEKQELAKRRERFNNYPEEQKNRWREMHRQLVADADRTTLFLTMQGHFDWVATKISSGQRARLHGIEDPKDRVDKIRELLENDVGDDTRVATSPDELKKFYLEELTTELKDELQQMPPNEMRIELQRLFRDREQK